MNLLICLLFMGLITPRWRTNPFVCLILHLSKTKEIKHIKKLSKNLFGEFLEIENMFK